MNCKHCNLCKDGKHDFCVCCGKCQNCPAVRAAPAPTVNPPTFVPFIPVPTIPYAPPISPPWLPDWQITCGGAVPQGTVEIATWCGPMARGSSVQS